MGKRWTNEDMDQLKKLFESEDGDLSTISEKMERTENGVRLKLLSMGLIDDEGEKMDVIRKDDQPTSPKQWTEEEVYHSRTCVMLQIKKVAFIGLGAMGYPMAGHLKKSGLEVCVYNRSENKAFAWTAEYDGLSAPTPSEAAVDADIVFLCVGNDSDVRAVTTGPEGVLQALIFVQPCQTARFRLHLWHA